MSPWRPPRRRRFPLSSQPRPPFRWTRRSSSAGKGSARGCRWWQRRCLRLRPRRIPRRRSRQLRALHLGQLRRRAGRLSRDRRSLGRTRRRRRRRHPPRRVRDWCRSAPGASRGNAGSCTGRARKRRSRIIASRNAFLRSTKKARCKPSGAHCRRRTSRSWGTRSRRRSAGSNPRQVHSLKVSALGADGALLWESPLVVLGPPAQPSHRTRNGHSSSGWRSWLVVASCAGAATAPSLTIRSRPV